MTQKQLQGDWEGPAKQWDELQPFHFSFEESTPEKCCLIPQTLIKNFQNKRSSSSSSSERAAERRTAQIEPSSPISCVVAARFPAFRPLTRWQFDPAPTAMTQTFASNIWRRPTNPTERQTLRALGRCTWD